MAEEMPEIIDSERGGQKLLLKGYVYYKSRVYKGRTYWQCRLYKSKQCTSTAMTSLREGKITILKETEHSHAPNREMTEAEKVSNTLKRKAKANPEMPPAQILRRELAKVPEEVLAHLPSRENLKLTMRRERRKDLPAEPLNLRLLRGIPELYKKTILGDNFLLYDSRKDDDEDDGDDEDEDEDQENLGEGVDENQDNEGKDRVIIFGTRRNLELLFRSKTWFVDGTFKTAANLFLQLFTIHGHVTRPKADGEGVDEVALPFVYAYLNTKKGEHYATVFREVISSATQFQIPVIYPERVMSDFEVAIINSVKEVIPGARVTCCNFHLGQSVYRKVQNEGLQDAYNNKDNREILELYKLQFQSLKNFTTHLTSPGRKCKTSKIFLRVLALVVLTIIPWPGPTVFKISCPRDSATIVRKIIQKKWTPVLEKYQVKIPIECPFHPMRDIFGPQQAAKQQHRPSQWTCGFCGKSFYEEKYLELHFDNRHKSLINMAEDAVCLADYCDIMRCEVLITQEMSSQFLNDPSKVNTDIEIWREATAYRTALTLTGPRELVRIPVKEEGTVTQERKSKPIVTPTPPPPPVTAQNLCAKGTSESPKPPPSGNDSPNSGDSDGNATKETCDSNDLVDSALPPTDKKQQRLSELQKLKANCKPEELQKLKQRCETLVRDCIAGLLVNLSVQDFKEVEEELNRVVCWYLTCDRYWEDSPGDLRPFPWGLVFVLVMVLSLGICMVYYVIWVLFDSDEGSIISGNISATASPLHHTNSRMQPPYGDEYYQLPTDMGDLGQNEHYIYVTYPPELKRRLLESCYNRTTRL